VAKSTFDASEEARLVALLHDRVGKAMQIDIRRETDIPRERSGKYRWVISHVPIPRLGGRDGGVA
jgi:phenylacetate-CoA ligase